MREAATVTLRLPTSRRGTPICACSVLFGSTGAGRGAAGVGLDLGYLAEAGFDPDALLLDLVTRLGTDRVDLVDRARAGAQLRFRAAAEGQLLRESQTGCFEKFWLEAVDFWCDAGRSFAMATPPARPLAAASGLDRDILAERVMVVRPPSGAT